MPTGPSEGHDGDGRPHGCTAGACSRTPTGRRELCDTHCDKLEGFLTRLRAEIAILDAVPSNGGNKAGSKTLAREKTPVRLDVLVTLDHRAGVGWSETEDDRKAAGATVAIWPMLRQWEWNIRYGQRLSQRSMPAAQLLEFITTHCDWSCSQPWVGAMYTDTKHLLRQLQRINGTAPDPPVGRCYLPAADTGTCQGPIFVDAAAGAARCGRCHATWDGPQLALLKYEMEKNDV